MKIWIVLDHADQSDDIGIYAYSTKAEAETCFRKRLEEYVTLYGKFEDNHGDESEALYGLRLFTQQLRKALS